MQTFDTMDFLSFRNKAPIITLKNEDCQCRIRRFGAQVSSLIVDGEEKIWVSSEQLVVADNAPSTGGIPLCFPQRDENDGKSELYGFSRKAVWEIHSHTENRAVLRLQDNDETYSIWPHKFQLEYTVELLDRGIRVSLKVSNTGELSSAFSFACNFRTHLLFDDTRKVMLLGFKKTMYTDNANGGKEKKQRGPVNVHTEALRTAKAAGRIGGLVDRVYNNPPRELVFKDLDTRVHLYVVTQSESWPNTTLYNPWLGDKQGEKDPDFDDDGYLHMISCGPAVAENDKVTVRPGDGGWSGWQTIVVPPS